MHFCRQSLHFASNKTRALALKQNYDFAQVHLGAISDGGADRKEGTWESFEPLRLWRSCEMSWTALRDIFMRRSNKFGGLGGSHTFAKSGIFAHLLFDSN